MQAVKSQARAQSPVNKKIPNSVLVGIPKFEIFDIDNNILTVEV
jgi:hypothetical protein